jgi:hypothetical protein
VKPGRTWLVYTLIRVGIFAGVLIVLLVLQITPWLAAVLAALISLCISIIVLRKPRDEASKTLYAARVNRGRSSRAPGETVRSEDEDIEDGAVDAAANTAASTGANTGAITGTGGRAPDAATSTQSANDKPSPTP